MAINSKPIARYNAADLKSTVRETYVYSDTSGTQNTIKSFDNLSGSNFLHDQVDLTEIFDNLGGAYSDGKNDLQDRVNAINLSYGDFDGDGKNDDVRLNIKGLSNFQLTFTDPASPYKGGFDIGSGAGIYDDIAVMSNIGPSSSAGGAQTLTAGNNVFFGDASQAATDTFVANKAGTGAHTIWNFDSSGDASHDQINLSSIFDSLGGKYANATNGFENREAALNFQTGDFNGDGKADVRITIDGVDNFSVNLIDPSNSSGLNAASSGSSAKLILGGGTPTPPPTTTPTTPTEPTTPTTPTTPSTPTTPTQPSSGSSSDEFKGKFPANFARLDNGINIERSDWGKVSLDDLKYLKSIGVENVRLLLNMNDGWGKLGQNLDANTNPYFQNVKAFMDKAINAGLAVVIDPIGNKPAFLSNPNDTKSISDTIAWEKNFAGWIAKNFSPKDVFIEPLNEPFMAQSETWWKIQGDLINAIHSVAPNFGVIAMSNGRDVDLPNQWDYVKAMINLQPYADSNVAYTIHYYSPMTFTHQGASWVSSFANLKNIHWPGAEGMTPQTIEAELTPLKQWADKYGVYMTINEYGVMNTVPQAEKVQWLTDLTKIFEKLGFGFDVWDLTKAFSISTTDSSGKITIPEVYQKALGLGLYADASNFDYNKATDTTTSSDSSTPTGSTSGTTGTGTTATGTTDTSKTPTTSTSFTADTSYAKSEKFSFSASDLHKTLTVNNFDAVSGKEMIQDQVNLKAVFDALGGAYSDGVNDLADRKAALQFATLDLNNDGKADDLQINIKGVADFHLNLIHPDAAYNAAYDIGSGQSAYDNIVVA